MAIPMALPPNPPPPPINRGNSNTVIEGSQTLSATAECNIIQPIGFSQLAPK